MSVLCVLYDDDRARGWQPLTLTRPAGELRCGGFTFRERIEAVFGVRCFGHLAALALRGFDEYGCAPVIEADSLPAERARLFVNSRFVPEWGTRFRLPSESGPLVAEGRVAGWFAAPGSPAPALERLESAATPGGNAVCGTFVEELWDLVDLSPGQIAADFAGAPPAPPVNLPAHVHRLGPASDLAVAPDVVIEPGVILDVTEGPVRLDAAVRVRAFTRLAGPAWIGTGTTLLGGTFSGVSIGPHCKVRGEVEASVLLGYSNKAHDGFLGHACAGRWVNLGAQTTNSDLKNNYRSVRIWTPSGERDTGKLKVGCFLGDHVKTAIGTLLNTGTVIGPGASLFGRQIPPRYVPPFAWGGNGLARYELEPFLETAATVMARRGVIFSAGMRRVLAARWEAGR
jgi:UDP-N-acetylglucosamine diphosphorylase/glucosamine-1-phosphate N-acetyltransferase